MQDSETDAMLPTDTHPVPHNAPFPLDGGERRGSRIARLVHAQSVRISALLRCPVLMT
ncbi:hypothetical protein [Actinomadura harenae]|uniref:hypothetical protein n=1 Tax=Actinomadura harenae TaxID=2483351 RepID=UPI0013157E26|nr:hypothetical protein [Actinomadura harenae]